MCCTDVSVDKSFETNQERNGLLNKPIINVNQNNSTRTQFSKTKKNLPENSPKTDEKDTE